jgi:hypothetical protein
MRARAIRRYQEKHDVTLNGGKARHQTMRVCAPLLLGALLPGTVLLMPVPAQAQMSAGFKFLEAVKKKDGAKVEEALSEPGTTIINTKDVTTGRTALHSVTERRDLPWLSYLISKGANVNARDNRGVTALQLAAGLNWAEGVAELVSNRALIDDPSMTGETPLIAAVHQRNLAMIRLLLKAGANPDRKDNSGRSARDYAALDGENSPLLAEIRTSARPAASRPGAGKVYGPTF